MRKNSDSVRHPVWPTARRANPITAQKSVGVWDTIERISKAVSIALVPVVLAVGGWAIQQELQDQTIKRDYVQLAVSILKEPDAAKISPAVRRWAARLLNDNSPTKLDSTALSELSTGSATLPAYSSNARPIESLQPAVAELARKLVEQATAQGIAVRIVRTRVTNDEQDLLYAAGRSASGPKVTNLKGGESAHNLGLAFDVAPVVDGKLIFDDKALYAKLGAIGRSLGLTWGGDWQHFKDYPHFELRQKQDSAGARSENAPSHTEK